MLFKLVLCKPAQSLQLLNLTLLVQHFFSRINLKFRHVLTHLQAAAKETDKLFVNLINPSSYFFQVQHILSSARISSSLPQAPQAAAPSFYD